MRHYWYLVAALPRTTLGQPPPLSPTDLRSRCAEQLVEADLAELDATLSGGGSSPFARAAAAHDRALACAAARLRAARLGIDPASAGLGDDAIPAEITRAVEACFAEPDPSARERRLDDLRAARHEALAQPHPFTLAAVQAHALTLQLATRWQQRTIERGREALEASLDRLLASAAVDSATPRTPSS